MIQTASSDITKLSLSELEHLLRDLRNIRTATRRTGKAGIAYSAQSSTANAVRVELPIGGDKTTALDLLKRL